MCDSKLLVEKYLGLGIELYLDDGKLKYKSLKGKLTTQEMQELSEYKNDIIDYLCHENESSKDNEEAFPLSAVQFAYLIGRSDMYPYGEVSCHIYQEIEYNNLDISRVQKIWNDLIKKHGMLRVIILENGFQKILKNIDEYIIRTGQRNSIRKELENKQYEIGSWPMFDIGVSKEGEKSFLHLSIDFIISDWSGILYLLSEFEEIYFYKKKYNVIEEKYTFKQYRIEEEKSKKGVNYKKSKMYWKQNLKKIHYPPTLPTKSNFYLKERHLQSFRRYCFKIDSANWRIIKETAQSFGITPTVAIMTMYALILKKYSINKNITLNMTSFVKTKFNAAVKNLIGDFTSTILLTIDSNNECFIDYAKKLNSELFRAIDNKSYSGVEVIRDLSNSNQRDVLMPYVFTSAIGLPKIDFIGKFDYGISQSPQVFIDCQCSEFGDGLQINWDVRDGVFKDILIEEMFSSFKAMLTRFAENPSIWDDATEIYLNSDVIDRENIIIGEDGMRCPTFCVGQIGYSSGGKINFTDKFGWVNDLGDITLVDGIDKKHLHHAYILHELKEYLLSLDEVIDAKINLSGKNNKKESITIELKVKSLYKGYLLYRDTSINDNWLLLNTDIKEFSKNSFTNLNLQNLEDLSSLKSNKNYILTKLIFIDQNFLDLVEKNFDLKCIVGFYDKIDIDDLYYSTCIVGLRDNVIKIFDDDELIFVQKLESLLSEFIDTRNLTQHDDFYSLGMDSLTITKLSIRLIDEFKLSLNFEQVLRRLLVKPSIREINSMISEHHHNYEQNIESVSSKKMIEINVHKAKRSKANKNIRVILHGAFGGVHIFDKFIDELVKQNQGDVYVMFVSDTNKFLKIESDKLVKELAVEFYREISKIDFKKIQLIGYSFSGNVALEVATLLSENGIKVDNLSIIESCSFPKVEVSKLIRDLNFLNAFGISLEDFGIRENAVIQAMGKNSERYFTVEKIISNIKNADDKIILKNLNEKTDEERLLFYSEKLKVANCSFIPKELFKEAYLVFEKSYEAQHYLPNIYFGDVDYYITKNKGGMFGDFEELVKNWDPILMGDLNKKYIEGNHYSIIQDATQVKELVKMLELK